MANAVVHIDDSALTGAGTGGRHLCCRTAVDEVADGSEGELDVVQHGLTGWLSKRVVLCDSFASFSAPTWCMWRYAALSW